MPQQEKCAICGQECQPALYRKQPDGTTEPLCENCADRWLGSDEEIGEPLPPQYFGPFPQEKQNQKEVHLKKAQIVEGNLLS